MQGMYFEALGKPAEAEALYKKELERDPHSPLILKRMVSDAGACDMHVCVHSEHCVPEPASAGCCCRQLRLPPPPAAAAAGGPAPRPGRPCGGRRGAAEVPGAAGHRLAGVGGGG